MAEKGFGVKEINLIGASGTPTIESPNNLNLNAVNVAISTNATVGGTLSVTGSVSVAPIDTFPATVRVPPMLTFVLIATLTAFKFKLFGLSIVGVPDAPIRFNSLIPKPFSAILLFNYL